MNTLIRRRLILSFIPLFAMMLLVYLVPIANTVFGAFVGYAGPDAGRFVGLGNFQKIQSTIAPTVLRTLVWTFGSVVPAVVLGLALASLFQRQFLLKKLVMSLCLLPYAIPLIIVASCWMFMYNQDFGLINVFLRKVGLIKEPLQFLSFRHAMASVIVVRAWRAMPFAFVNYYAAMSTIPREQYEAADVDGASGLQKFRYITLPNLRSITSMTLIILTVWTFLVFDIIYGMTGGGPIDVTNIISIRMYRELTNMRDFGTAAAWSLTAMIVLGLISVLYWRLFPLGDTREKA